MEILLIVVLLVIAAETTYLTAAHVRRHKHVKHAQHPIFVDTSVLIDGRILSLAKSGFITSTLLIPRSVVGELQLLADNGDSEKRTRARHGLDIVKELQKTKQVNVELFNDGVSAPEGVDNRLLALAKAHKGSICTIDYNLNKVAQVEDITVLNVNELAKSLRMAYLPGEHLLLELTQKGNDSHQAIGHLQDGTMVVVEHASAHVGTTKEIEFIRSLQTAAGKMMFARLIDKPVKQTAKPVKQAVKQKPAGGKSSSVKGRQPQQQAAQTQDGPAPAKKPQQRQSTQSANSGQGQQQPRRNNRRKTNEDRLVELANQTEES